VVSFSSLVWKENISLTNEVLPTELAIFLEDQETNVIPSKESGYYFDRVKSSCNNGTIEWDSVNWNPNIKVNSNATTRTKCNLVFTKVYNEGILNGTDPVIKDELIPVKIEENGTVRKADLKSKWYEYASQNWANAVITRNSYNVLDATGKVHGATKETDYVSLDGVDDYIDLGLENYDFGKNMTMIVKLNIRETTEQSNHMVITNFESGGFSIEYYKDKILGSITKKDYNYVQTPLYQFTLNKDFVVAITYNGQYFKLYIDGELIGQTEYSDSLMPSIMPFYLGANPHPTNPPAQYANASYFQAAIYNRALSAEEIKNMSKEIKITDDTGLLSYVDFTNKTNYEANEIIPEENIESYFTWIPRYKYQIFDDGNYLTRGSDTSGLDSNAVQTIQVVFESKDITPSTGSTVGSWLTHPAFTAFDSNGMWVGKFETGTPLTNNYNVRNGEAVQIKPNVTSWRSIQVANAFYTSYDYKRNLDSHMMKNTEWGAVAYLQHSIYGSSTSVRLNNNNSYVTGYAANNEPTCGFTASNETCNKYCNNNTCNVAYPNNPINGSASTTGNITGIYDMSGGAWEYVMGVMLDEAGNPVSGRNSTNHSGFNGTLTCPTCDGDTSGKTNITDGYEWPEAKYYDTYIYENSSAHYERRILGDATGEVGPFGTVTYLTQSRGISSWYSNVSWFVFSGSPWFERGGYQSSGLDSGVFAFGLENGRLQSWLSFRMVLSPNKS